MECPACGYLRKPTDDNPDWECPLCASIYEKVQCSLIWLPSAPSEKIIPDTISKSFIITEAKKLYSFNRARKKSLAEIVISEEELHKLSKFLGIDIQKKRKKIDCIDKKSWISAAE